MRCYASAVLAVGRSLSVCPSVRPSQASTVAKRLDNQAGMIWHGVFPRPLLQSVLKKFGLLRTLDLKFYDDTCSLVPAQELSTEFDRRPSQVYYTEHHFCVARCTRGCASRGSIQGSWYWWFCALTGTRRCGYYPLQARSISSVYCFLFPPANIWRLFSANLFFFIATGSR